jgi:hypothetical protein
MSEEELNSFAESLGYITKEEQTAWESFIQSSNNLLEKYDAIMVRATLAAEA